MKILPANSDEGCLIFMCVIVFCDLVLRCLQAQDFPNPEIWVWNRGSPSWIPGVFFFRRPMRMPIAPTIWGWAARVYHMNARGNMIEKDTIILCPILFDLFGDELLEISRNLRQTEASATKRWSGRRVRFSHETSNLWILYDISMKVYTGV